MSDSTYGFVVLFLLTREWTSTIVTGLIEKGFSVSAGFDSEKIVGKMFGEDVDKVSQILCLKITRDKTFTRRETQDIIVNTLKINNISIFGGIISLSSDFNVLASTMKKDVIEQHPYR